VLQISRQLLPLKSEKHEQLTDARTEAHFIACDLNFVSMWKEN
jgi:hypothetical protein